MEARWSWVQTPHSTMASSEFRDMCGVYNREVGKITFQIQDIMACSVITYQQGKLITMRERERENTFPPLRATLPTQLHPKQEERLEEEKMGYRTNPDMFFLFPSTCFSSFFLLPHHNECDASSFLETTSRPSRLLAFGKQAMDVKDSSLCLSSSTF